MPIDLLAQSAALFYPYRFRKFNGTWWFNMCRSSTFSTVSHALPKVPFCTTSTATRHLGFGSHELGGVRFHLCKRVAFWEGMLALPYRFRKFNGTWWFNMCKSSTFSTAPHGAVEKVSALVYSPPLEGWQAYAFCNACI